MNNVDRLESIEEIKRLKTRYCRYLDGKAWSMLPSLFDEAVRFEGFVAAPKGADGPTFVEGLTRRMQDAVTFHQVFMPDIVFRGDDLARVVWSMTDYVQWPQAIGLYGDPEAVGFRGYGYYEEEYRRGPNGWRISFMRLTRHRLDPVRFDGKPGPFGGVPLSPELMRPDPHWLTAA
jgi:hypothetical protein